METYKDKNGTEIGLFDTVQHPVAGVGLVRALYTTDVGRRLDVELSEGRLYVNSACSLWTVIGKEQDE